MHAVPYISPAVLFRVVEKHKPTVLVDEGDTFLRDNDDFRGILNGGHDQLSAYVWRNVGDDHEPRQFRVWAPKAIAMIGRIPDTLEDRSIVVPLRRRRDGETVDRFRADRIAEFASLRSKAARWAADNLQTLSDCDPRMPASLNDRALDNWRPLIAIADHAGGHWPNAARTAAIALSSDTAKDDESLSPGVLLLRDMREIMSGNHSISSTLLLAALIELDEAPWREWRRGLPITTAGIARLLKPFKVKPYRAKGAASIARSISTICGRGTSNFSPRRTRKMSANLRPCAQPATKISNDFNGSSQVAVSRTLGAEVAGQKHEHSNQLSIPGGPSVTTVRGRI